MSQAGGGEANCASLRVRTSEAILPAVRQGEPCMTPLTFMRSEAEDELPLTEALVAEAHQFQGDKCIHCVCELGILCLTADTA